MRYFLFLLLHCISGNAVCQSFTTIFETSNGKQTPAYTDIIKWWQQIDAASPMIQMRPAGPTDAGFPLHLVLISGDKDFNIASLRQKQKTILFILNGIHPGEPDGIDASMLLARDIVQGKFSLPKEIVLAIIPVYNIGGALNRSPHFRVDQNGPEEIGFRGNSQNLDLNRDFIKCDSKEALSFAKIFQSLDPDIFIDNHVSNGADYQHVMTLIASQHNKLGGPMGTFMKNAFVPSLNKKMKERGYDLVPYVNHFGETPEKGWSEFWDSPRYSSGYASLWHSFAFVPETHMLKPYPQRVAATKALMETFISFAKENSKQIKHLRQQQKDLYRTVSSFPLKWSLDTTQHSGIVFKGYTSGKKQSDVSGLPRLYYDRDRPFEKRVPFYDTYRDTLSIAAPKAYIIPQGWTKVIERLQANGVNMQSLKKDTVITVEAYRILAYQSAARPYEGHHPNTKVQVEKRDKKIKFRAGDFIIPFAQPAYRFLIETLEPHAEDSYLTWNFFDGILAQKEHFSDYAFEETAAAFLAANPSVKTALEEKRKSDASFAASAAAQLEFVYTHSPYYEQAHLQYPVYRIK